VIGEITGHTYIFERAGSIVDVDIQDAEILEQKRTPPSCCGTPPQKLFEIVR